MWNKADLLGHFLYWTEYQTAFIVTPSDSSLLLSEHFEKVWAHLASTHQRLSASKGKGSGPMRSAFVHWGQGQGRGPLSFLMATLKQQETTPCSGCCNKWKVFLRKGHMISMLLHYKRERSQCADSFVYPRRNGKNIYNWLQGEY